ncbi:MAG: Gfo/Idh/MocA family oxidoreductase [Planctomycetes bacterium]|nr:Gfo/Idh/MocA family oxidoreductase [Planctomycetota bacterium]
MCSRRSFLSGALTTAAASSLWGASATIQTRAEGAEAVSPTSGPKIKLGLVGCGGRGLFLARLFQQHGGFEFHAVADYFPDVANRLGDAMGVASGRRFSGLSGYKRVIDSGVDALVLETPPCFFPEHATAAVDAGLHVYMAKPVAVDVPGCRSIEAAAQKATQNRRVFLVDLQMHTDPVNQKVAERVRKGEAGRVGMISSKGISGGHPDPPKTATIESRLRNNIWDNDIAIGGGHVLVFSIHSIDAGLWVVGRHPVAATGSARICRKDPHGDARDVYSVVFEYPDGLIHEHSGQHLPNGNRGDLSCHICGQTGHAKVTYWGEAEFHVRGKKPFSGEVENLYTNGAKHNIALFYRAVAAERYDNPTVRRAVDSTLACILAREAFDRKCRLTWEELLKENKRIEVDLSGLKA